MRKKESITISETTPLQIGKLKVYPNKLEYGKTRCNFTDIEHIGWHWISQDISIVNTQSVNLSLYIRGRKNPIQIQKSTMYVKPQIVTAYNFIARETFQNRLGFYTSQLEKAGGFKYGNYNIYSDGRVISKGKTFSLSKANIDVFKIIIKQDGLFAPKIKIDLYRDRDVILTLIDFILKNPQDPSVYVKNHIRRKETKEKSVYFLRDIVSLMAKLASADGHVSTTEIEIVKNFLTKTMKLDKENISKAASIFNSAKSSPSSFEYFSESLASQFKNNKNMLSGILDLLFSIAIADGVLSAEEELLLLAAENIFGVKGKSYNQYKNQTPKSKHNKKEYYLRILGLPTNATQHQVKTEYKRLVMKFHPDRMHSLGEDFKKNAEIKMKEINQAYQYLRKALGS